MVPLAEFVPIVTFEPVTDSVETVSAPALLTYHLPLVPQISQFVEPPVTLKQSPRLMPFPPPVHVPVEVIIRPFFVSPEVVEFVLKEEMLAAVMSAVCAPF